MDPALRELLAGDEGEEIEVILKLRHPQSVPPHVRLVARFGQVVTGRVERRWIREVWGYPEVESFKAARLLQAEPAIIDLEAAGDVDARLTDVRRPSRLKASGRGVVIGLVDVGCDFAHPHFRHADGSTRLLALWDQSQAASFPPSPYGYGVLYTRDDLNRALTHPHPYKALGYHPAKADPLGIGAHGTLVMDIAAGNGHTPGSPMGLAPEADLVFVHVSTGIREGLANLGDSVRILEALDFIARTAGGRPCVINVSMGRRGGSHDGLSPVEQGMDTLLLEKPGIALVLSTGNYFASQAHASGRLRPAQQRSLIWQTDKADITPNELEIWYSGKDAMILEVRAPGGGPLFRAALAEDGPILVGGRTVGHVYHRAMDPNNGDNQINVFLRPEAPAGEWTVTLIGEDIVDGTFHAWVERDAPCPHCDSRFEPGDADPYCTTGTLCNGFRTIAVGACDGHSLEREMAVFSSCGPLRDLRQKPDLVAPGVQVLGARSAPWGEDEHAELRLTRMSGTSFAAPQVTGTIALMFEAAERPLSIQETHRLLLGNTRSVPEDGFTDAVRVGSGYLDVEAAVAAARRTAEEDSSRFAETESASEVEGAAGSVSVHGAGLMRESTMAGEDEDRREEEVEVWPTAEANAMTGGLKHLGLQSIYTEAGTEALEAFPDTMVEVEEPEAEEPEEEYEPIADTEVEAEEPGREGPREWFRGVALEEPEESSWGAVEEEMSFGERLVDVADRMIASGSSPAKPADFLSRALSETGARVFSDPLGMIRFPAPEVLWSASKRPTSRRWVYIERFLEVIAAPGEGLEWPLKTGDILVRVALGEPGLGHLALIADPRVRRIEELPEAGLTPEGRRPGGYVQVVEGGVRPHGSHEGFARRIVDTAERVPGNQLIVRLVPDANAESLTEQAPAPKVTSGQFGKALSAIDPPSDAVKLLKLSPSFMKMANNLDGLYVDIWANGKQRVLNTSPDGVVINGSFAGRRVLKVEKSYTSSSWFAPYSVASPGYYDGIYIEQIGRADLGNWIEIIAHETAHAFRFANGQIARPKVTCPQPKKDQADGIRASIDDEILVRKIEAQVLKEIQADPGGKIVSSYQPTTGSTDRKIVERDFLTAQWDGTYLEHFVIDTLVQEVIVCDKLDEKVIKEKNYNVGRINISKRKLKEYLVDQDYFDPDSGKLTRFATRYARLRFIQRVIDARWKEFKAQHSTSDKDFAEAKEKVLQEHAAAFFQAVIKYTPLKP